MNRKILKKLLLVAVAIVLAFTSAGCTGKGNEKASAPAERTITDMEGNVIKLPEKVEKAGTSWPGFMNVILAVGGSDKLVAASKAINTYPWAMKLFPSLQNIAYPFAGELNMEELLKNKPDVLFLRKGDPVDKVKEAGIPVIMIYYKDNSIHDMIDAVSLTGKTLGEKEAQKAEAYKQFVLDKIDKISKAAKSVPDDKRVKALTVSVSGKELSVWGRNTPQNEAITLAGGINAAEKDIDGSKKVSYEQILQWNPDVIIVEGSDKDRAILQNPVWNQVEAVKQGKVFISPHGVFAWARLGSEVALYFPWLAKTLYPEQYKDFDIQKEAKSYYKTFFQYDLSDDELSRILNAQPPA